MLFGQIVIGLPGCGKTTYCKVMQDSLREAGRSVQVVNLDPANSNTPYDCSIDVGELITLQDAMQHLNIGPNGSFIYCIEFLEANMEWLQAKIKQNVNSYFIFDCPGQIELYTHHASMRNICKLLVESGLKLTAVQLLDSHFCGDAAKFISGTMTSLSTMLQLELPHVNILSKCDMTNHLDSFPFRFDMYTEVLDLNYVLDSLQNNPLTQKYGKLNECLAELIHNFSLVSYKPFNIKNKDSIARVIEVVDKANGFIFLVK